MKFFGISIRDLSGSTKLIYVVLFSAIVIAALIYGLNQVDQKQAKGSNKRRSPKKDKKDSAKKD